MNDSIESALNEKGFYITTTEGNSMSPMLATGTRVLIKKPSFPLKKYDIPVYRRSGHYTMHRIVWAKGHRYVICGDNRSWLEKDISEDDIVGVFCGLFRGERFIRAEEKELLAYGKKACRNLPIRYLKGKIKNILRKLSLVQ